MRESRAYHQAGVVGMLGAIAMFASGCGGSNSDSAGSEAGAAGTSMQSTGTAGTSAASTGAAGTSTPSTGAAGTGDDPAGAAGSGGAPLPVTAEVFGPVHAGSYNNGPVDYAETQFHNACAPKEKYAPQIQQLYGPYLAGVDNSLAADGSLCDACALLTTGLGKQVLVRIVTYGVSKAPGDMDLSPEAYNAVSQSDPHGTPDIPRPMTWQLARCADNGNIYLQYQTGANPYWTSFWVRNPKLPIAKVESEASGESKFSALDRSSDGPFTDGDGVGTGAFQLRITASDGQVVTQSFPSFQAGTIVASSMQFH